MSRALSPGFCFIGEHSQRRKRRRPGTSCLFVRKQHDLWSVSKQDVFFWHGGQTTLLVFWMKMKGATNYRHNSLNWRLKRCAYRCNVIKWFIFKVGAYNSLDRRAFQRGSNRVFEETRRAVVSKGLSRGAVFPTGHWDLPGNIPVQNLQSVWTCLNSIYSPLIQCGKVFQMRTSGVPSLALFTRLLMLRKCARNPVNVHAGGNSELPSRRWFKKMILFSSGVRTADVSLKKSTVDRRDVFDEIYFFFFLILHNVYFDLF